jgi:hypothetical protein
MNVGALLENPAPLGAAAAACGKVAPSGALLEKEDPPPPLPIVICELTGALAAGESKLANAFWAEPGGLLACGKLLNAVDGLLAGWKLAKEGAAPLGWLLAAGEMEKLEMGALLAGWRLPAEADGLVREIMEAGGGGAKEGAGGGLEKEEEEEGMEKLAGWTEKRKTF